MGKTGADPVVRNRMRKYAAKRKTCNHYSICCFWFLTSQLKSCAEAAERNRRILQRIKQTLSRRKRPCKYYAIPGPEHLNTLPCRSNLNIKTRLHLVKPLTAKISFDGESNPQNRAAKAFFPKRSVQACMNCGPMPFDRQNSRAFFLVFFRRMTSGCKRLLPSGE